MVVGLVMVRRSATFTPGTAPTYSIWLQDCLTRLRTFCNNNALAYSSFQAQVDIDLPTGNFIFSASARLYPNTFINIFDAEQVLGLQSYTIVNV